MPSPNTNCLAGLACPKCGSTGPYAIQATCNVVVHDDGTLNDTANSFEWEDTSYCTCQTCDHSATIRDFTLSNAT